MAAKNETIHRKKLFQGRETAEEVWQKHLGRSCQCGRPGLNRIIIFARLDEWEKHFPLEAEVIKSSTGLPFVPFVKTAYGDAVKWSDTVWCAMCMPQAEKASAKHPTWAWVDVIRGPGKDKPVVQRPR